MKKLVSITIGILSIFGLGYLNVDAAPYKYHGYIYEGDKINNIYYKNKDNTLNEARIYKQSDSENITYSIEYDNNTSGASEDDYDDTFSYKETKLTKEQTDKMNLIGYYGYNYKDENYDHTDIKWYAITQYLIWKVEDNNNLADLVDAHGNKIYDKEIKEIEELIKHHYLKPNFGSKRFKIKIYDELTIEDQNKVLDEYELAELSNANYNIQDNKINITTDVASVNVLRFTKDDKRYPNSAIFFVSEQYRDAMQIGKFESISMNVTITSISGKIIINKSGEQLIDYQDNKFIYEYQPVKGSVYYLYAKEDIYNNQGNILYKKDEKVGELTTGESTSFDSLYPSNYYVKEIVNAYPYLVNNEIYDVNLDIDQNNQTLSFTSDFQDVTVSFKNIQQKIAFEGGNIKYSYSFLPGTEFALYNKEDIYSNKDSTIPIVKKDTLLGRSISDSHGLVTFDLDLPLGSYYIIKTTEDSMYHGNFEISPFIFSFNSGDSDRHYNLMDYYHLLNYKKITFSNNNESKDITIYDKDKNTSLSYDIEDELTMELPYGEYYYQINNQSLNPFTVNSSSNNYIEINESVENKEEPSNNNSMRPVVWEGNSNPSKDDIVLDEVTQNAFTPPIENPEISNEDLDDDINGEEEPDDGRYGGEDNNEENQDPTPEESSPSEANSEESKEDNETESKEEPLIPNDSNNQENDDYSSNIEEEPSKEEEPSIQKPPVEEPKEEINLPKEEEIEKTEESLPDIDKTSEIELPSNNQDEDNKDNISNDEPKYSDKEESKNDESLNDYQNSKEEENKDTVIEIPNNPTSEIIDDITIKDDNNQNIEEEKDIVMDNLEAKNEEIIIPGISSSILESINTELNVEVPATDNFDFVLYISFIILMLTSLSYLNAKE